MQPAHQLPELRLEGAPAVGAAEPAGLTEAPQRGPAAAARLGGLVTSRILQLLPHRGEEAPQRRLADRGRFNAPLRRTAFAEVQRRHLRVHDLGQVHHRVPFATIFAGHDDIASHPECGTR